MPPIPSKFFMEQEEQRKAGQESLQDVYMRSLLNGLREIQTRTDIALMPPHGTSSAYKGLREIKRITRKILED